MHSDLFSTPIFFLLMPFFSKRVIYSSVFAKEQSAVLSFELETVDFTFARYRSKFTELDFRFRHRYATVHIQRVTWWYLFFYSRHFVPCTESFVFRNRRPSGADHLSGWDFNRRECLQFDHSQRFESTTDRFALQLYGKFNWKYGQIGLLCSLCPVATFSAALSN